MSPTPTKRVAIYARVSTFDKGQDPETQLLQLREYARRRGFDVAGEYVDHATGTNEERTNYQRLLDDVRKRLVDVVQEPLAPWGTSSASVPEYVSQAIDSTDSIERAVVPS